MKQLFLFSKEINILVFSLFVIVIAILNKNKIKEFTLIVFLFIPIYIFNGETPKFIDTYNYKREFLKSTNHNIILESKGVIFDYLTYVIRLITNNYKVYFLIVALLIIVPFLKIIKKYSKNTNISLITVYPYLIMFTTNILRQGFATVFVFYSYFSSKKYISILLIIIASLIHKSAILILPIIFIKEIKIKKIYLYLILTLSLVVLLFFPLNSIIQKNLKHLSFMIGKDYTEGYSSGGFTDLTNSYLYKIFTLYYILLGYFIVYNKEKLIKKGMQLKLFNIFYFSIVMMGFFSTIIIVRRMIDYIRIIEVLAWPYIFDLFERKMKIMLGVLLFLQMIIILLS